MSNDNQSKEMSSMDIYEVMKHLPHRYPFLLIDRVLDYTAGERLTAIKNVTVNEPFFPGHFPHRPVFPGVLMLEAMAQATGILAFKTTEDLPSEESLYYFVGIDNARFKKPVEPGDQLLMEVEVVKRKRDMWKFKATATVDGKVVCSADLMCARKDIS
ncbi:3-hydroxyacyl-ACP dehydratase FabZ [Kangiella marina]|uniref:3-hydroxyacyl-[acyl-carrier-protein] dehydratase FabZ n=1 Tax=Kangiella marina TaxID=1079178 RepID=A0ABP8INY2_9GAMM